MKTAITTLLLGGLLACGAARAQTTLTVDNNPGSVAMYNNFAAAYAAASDGDTILLAGSAYGYGSHSIYKRLTIIGPGYFLAENGVPGVNPRAAQISLGLNRDSLNGNSSGTRLLGLYLSIAIASGYSNPIIKNVTIDKCYIENPPSSGSSIAGRVIISRCFANSIGLHQRASGSIIRNSICEHISFDNFPGYATGITFDRLVVHGGRFEGSASNSITNSIFVFSNASSFVPNGCTISHCMAVGFGTLPAGNGNINSQMVNNVFLNTGSTDGKWRLKAGSAAAGMATAGSDMGAYGGPDPYVLSGVPGIPRITRLVVPTTATGTSGLRFEVDAKAFAE